MSSRSSNEGIHSGWSKQIPKDFLEQNAPAFVKVYDEFFKQQQYRMEILERCDDPNNYDANGLLVKYPTNPVYPPGTVCARTFYEQVCFFAGESGSPLMIKRDQNSEKLYIEGIASYIEGCSVVAFAELDRTEQTSALYQETFNP